MVYQNQVYGICTGTLVAPDIVLTAAHCVHPQVLGLDSQAQVTQLTQIGFDTPNAFSLNGGYRVAAKETIPHPGFSAQNAGAGNDIAIVKLVRPVTDRAWTPINRVYNDAPVGMKLLQVGYGASKSGTQNQNTAGPLNALKDKVTISCASFGSSDQMHICYSQTDGSGKCVGDSGGPSFLTINGVQKVVGVTSVGDQNCAQAGLDIRVDTQLAWLDQVAPGLGGEPPDLADLGEECTTGTQCDSGLCVTGPGGEMLCSELCDVENDSCPSGYECLPAGGGQGACWPQEGGSDDNDGCDDDNDNGADGGDGGGDGGCGCRTGGSPTSAPLGGALLLGLFGWLAIRRRA
jgi:MYXO-CTERM domain-containing protein